jgi:hypothetical protein
MNADRNEALATECRNFEQSCLYTSTSLFIWLRCLRILRIAFIVAPLVLGSFASWKLLTSSDSEAMRLFVAVCAFLAGLLPSVYSALKLDGALKRCERLAGEFKNLQDRFRVAATVLSLEPFDKFEVRVQPILDRLEAARSESYTAPEWCFKEAQKKITKGHYDYSPPSSGGVA